MRFLFSLPYDRVSLCTELDASSAGYGCSSQVQCCTCSSSIIDSWAGGKSFREVHLTDIMPLYLLNNIVLLCMTPKFELFDPWEGAVSVPVISMIFSCPA